MNLKSIRLFLLITIKYLSRFRVWVGIVVATLILLIIAQVKFNLLFPSTNILRVGLIGTYQEHDIPKEVTNMASSGLVEASADGRIKPNLVTGWDVNNDATIFKFKLKKDLKWVDNTPIKSSDLDFNIPNTDISFPDEHTIQFKLKEPYSPLPSLLTKPIFKKGTLIGTGPYRIIRVEKSRIFITKIILIPQNTDLPEVHFRFYPTEKVGITGFNLGEIEVLLGLSQVKILSNEPQIILKSKTDYSKIVTVLFQTKDSLLSSRSLRQALSFSAPQIKGEELADNPYPPNSWVYNSESKKYLSNPSEAKAALDRAKSSVKDDTLKQELILTTTPNLEDVGRPIVNTWKDLGFNAKLRVESGIPQNFQSLLSTQSIPVDPDQYFLWHATQEKTNLTRYDSKRVDKDLEDGRKIMTEADRKAKYFDFQKALLEDAPAIFLYFPKYNIAYLKKSETLLNKVLDLQLSH